MKTKPLVLLALMACNISAALVAGADRPSGSAVLEYLAQRASRLAADLPQIPNDRVAWEKRRDLARRQLAQILGLPQREPMRATILATRSEGDLVVEELMYLWTERAYVAANVVRPAITPQPGQCGSSCRPWSCRPAGSAS